MYFEGRAHRMWNIKDIKGGCRVFYVVWLVLGCFLVFWFFVFLFVCLVFARVTGRIEWFN